MIAPDETTFAYLERRRYTPHGTDWESAVEEWRSLPTDEGAVYDRSVTLDAATPEPMIT